MYDKSIDSYHENNGTVIKVNVSISKDFKPLIGGNLENWAFIEVSSSSIDIDEQCFWDNMNFFLIAPNSEIKKQCKRELIDKGFYYKGFFKDLQNMIDEFVNAGYLTRDCEKDY